MLILKITKMVLLQKINTTIWLRDRIIKKYEQINPKHELWKVNTNYIQCLLSAYIISLLIYENATSEEPETKARCCEEKHALCTQHFSCFSCPVAKLCLNLCNPIGCSMQGSSVFHDVLEVAQMHVSRISGAV